jgi:hypothetical protein
MADRAPDDGFPAVRVTSDPAQDVVDDTRSFAYEPDDPLVGMYADDELARIENGGRPALAVIPGGEPAEPDVVDPVPPVPRYPVARRFGITGAMLAGAMMGVAEVFEPERDRSHQIEFAPDGLDEAEQLVTFEMVPGAPRASRLIVRPWLLGRHRRG